MDRLRGRRRTERQDKKVTETKRGRNRDSVIKWQRERKRKRKMTETER